MSKQTNLDAELLRKRNNLRWPLRAKIVLEKYRLNSRDLELIQGRRRDGFRTKIVNVSLEGVEEFRILLHLEALTKPLRLTPEQRQQIADIMQSHHFADWIGHVLELSVANSQPADLEHNHIDLSITSISTSATTSTSATASTSAIAHRPEPTTLPQNTNPSHNIAPHADEDLSPATQESDPTRRAQPRTPHTHFSGVGQEFSVLDPNAKSKRISFFDRERAASLARPTWLQQIGQSQPVRQLRFLLDPSMLIALLLFLIVVAAVQFETILGVLAGLLGR